MGRAAIELWYTCTHPNSLYGQSVQKLADGVDTLRQSSGLEWRRDESTRGAARPESKGHGATARCLRYIS